MQNYLSTFVNNNGVAFPGTGAINASGGAATDGTEFTANMINDSMWGIWQAIMDHVGQTPNGIVEAVGASQILDALQKFETPGKLVSVALNDDPAVLGIRMLQLTGQGILRANYPELDNNVYVGDGNNAAVAAAGGAFYRADDAAGTIPNIAGIYLILPDARGRVIRGLDLTGSVDPDGAGRVLGDFQDDAMMRITGKTGGVRVSGFSVGGVFTTNAETAVIAGAGGSFFGMDFDNATSVSPNPAKTDDDESRMINLSANLMITY